MNGGPASADPVGAGLADEGTAPLGLCGKLPDQGDFVRYGLDGAFCRPWEAWVARWLGAARDARGERFDDLWLMAPSWRFAVAAGVAGPAAMAGVLVASRDRIGRPFPLTVAAPLSAGADLSAVPAAWEGRLAAAEALAAAALAGKLASDALVEAVAALAAPPLPAPPAAAGTADGLLRLDLAPDAPVASGYGAALAMAFGRPSLWWRAGALAAPPVLAVAAALPAPDAAAGLFVPAPGGAAVPDGPAAAPVVPDADDEPG
ncbi:type VI secretion system-associated protein TagF [Azospirillum sp. ST 5-10]|uniref:type VI secretion system-associated protein TagF n=1 Tax=unclassified Azospirillum TaxID=2630922 RepID=UPI003F49E60C